MSGVVVSVVMGVCNGVDLLAETVESILAQEGVELEFIVVDDGSSDGAGALLDGYAAGDPRLRVIHQENRGLTRALIRGCSEARGEFIARQDNGDLSLPGRLRRQQGLLAATPELLFVSAWTEYCGPCLEHISTEKGSGEGGTPCRIIDLQREKLVLDGPSHHGSVMFRRSAYEAVDGYHHQFAVAQDWDLWYRLAERGSFMMIPETLYRARLLPGSISGERKPEQRLLSRLSQEALRLRLAGEPETPLLERAALIRPERRPEQAVNRAAWLYFIGEGLRRNGDRRARGYFRGALRENPLLWKGWFRLVQAFLSPLRQGKRS